ncbi:Por secretion system C-terminal sorting domain-containing protein [Tangfeifania diversioriginum]|uniref:Por secretion system C-terminal sorting domain-containing protein n=1 Tax=Tangfeifania diversioriginum TaxID=1168035 RepID=A0A1M6LEC9_9BACT|nr:CotH kinase family protein [Tangfeifania diversioriginum]SHJ69560.1 Por secretion system C-terminal sorting domain-containing protein [Tangfeifania diversioriginum]
MALKRILVFIIVLLAGGPILAQNQSFSSKLPLVFIDTNGRHIPDEPKILVDMGIIWNGEGEDNYTSGDFNHYYGKVGIEIRGSSSQMFPKKSYGFETRNQLGEDIDFPILGLPEEEDWILYAPYSDKSLIRNVLTFSLAKPLGHYTSRCRFVELFLNNEYQGIYVLMEKIKREDTRVDIATLNPDETEGEDLTGGYIVKIDKTTGSGGDGWYSKYKNANGNATFYQYEVPDDEEIVQAQKNYIQDYINGFEDAVYYKKYEGEGSYRDYINVNSFIDFILISELTKNIDSYRLSTFLYKDKGGKLNAGPIWDFNLAYGNADYLDGWNTYGFQIQAKMEDDHWGNPFWWPALWGDRVFVNQMKCRWEELRKDAWTNQRIFEVADSLVQAMGSADDRNFNRWPVLGQYVWPNYYVGTSHQDEVNWLKNWLEDRLWWLDANLPGQCGEDVPEIVDEFAASVYPSPFNAELKLEVASDVNITLTLKLFNANGSLVESIPFSVVMGEQEFSMNTEHLPNGLYIYTLKKHNVVIQKGKLVKY